jgi:hypothetical protein
VDSNHWYNNSEGINTGLVTLQNKMLHDPLIVTLWHITHTTHDMTNVRYCSSFRRMRIVTLLKCPVPNMDMLQKYMCSWKQNPLTELQTDSCNQQQRPALCNLLHATAGVVDDLRLTPHELTYSKIVWSCCMEIANNANLMVYLNSPTVCGLHSLPHFGGELLFRGLQ